MLFNQLPVGESAEKRSSEQSTESADRHYVADQVWSITH